MISASSTISISSDDSTESFNSARETSEKISNHGADDVGNELSSESSSLSSVKPRNIAVKKGAASTGLQSAQPGVQRTKEKIVKWDKDLLANTRFLDDFNPKNSQRERNKRYNITKSSKQTNKLVKKKSTSMYDEQGRIRMTKEDICDCFDIKCPGCHFPCMDCKSPKCGIHCRVNRKWAYNSIDFDGRNQSVPNPLLTTVRY